MPEEKNFQGEFPHEILRARGGESLKCPRCNRGVEVGQKYYIYRGMTALGAECYKEVKRIEGILRELLERDPSPEELLQKVRERRLESHREKTQEGLRKLALKKNLS